VRYLALTAVIVRKAHYDTVIVPDLEALKRRHFRYDPDDPVILHRSDIVKRRRWFGVLQDAARNTAWENDILAYIQGLQAQVFTVVIDKDEHRRRYPQVPLFDPYDYSLAVLLNRARGYLNIRGWRADVMAEGRGKVEDAQLAAAYTKLRTVGGGMYGSAPDYANTYPAVAIAIRRKDHNVAGLQIADLLAASQKLEIVSQAGRPLTAAPSAFTNRFNAAAGHMINQYGRYLLD
jgi:hypothetical protein